MEFTPFEELVATSSLGVLGRGGVTKKKDYSRMGRESSQCARCLASPHSEQSSDAGCSLPTIPFYPYGFLEAASRCANGQIGVPSLVTLGECSSRNESLGARFPSLRPPWVNKFIS